MEVIKSIVLGPVVTVMFRVFPFLRSNRELSRIKNAVERG
jgi:hypothetical protein